MLTLKNTTAYSDRFLRKMVKWCCKRIGHPWKLVKKATFCNRTYGGGCNGRAWFRSRFLVRIGPNVGYPCAWKNHRGVDLEFVDQMSWVVYVTAHELQHLKNWHTPGMDESLRQSRDLEPHCVRIGKAAMLSFEEKRAELMEAWGKPTVTQAAKVAADAGPRNLTAERASKVQADLARWQRKLKLAQTKVKKLKRKAAYYEKQLSKKSTCVAP